MQKIRTRLWVLVMNSAHARVLRGAPGPDEPDLPELVLQSEVHKMRDIMPDKPGRAYSSARTGRRSSMEFGTKPLEEDEREFVREVIALLESHHRAGEFDKLAIFADPDMLGVLRQLMPPALTGMIVKEVPKNLLHLSAHDLPRFIAKEMEEGDRIS